MQGMEREYTDTTEQIARLPDFNLKRLLEVSETYTTNLRNAVVNFVRCASVAVLQEERLLRLCKRPLCHRNSLEV